MHAHAPSIETTHPNRTKTAILAAVLAVLIACFAALAAPPEEAVARPSEWGTQAVDNSGNSYKFGLDNIRITSQTNTEAKIAVDVWVATAYSFNHRVQGWAYVDEWDKGSQGYFQATNSGSWSPTKETTWYFTVQKQDSSRSIRIEGAFQLDDESGAPWLYKAFSPYITIPAAKKTDLSTGSLSMSPMDPEIGDTITASYYKSGVSTSDLKVSWWRGDTWNSAQLAQSAMSYSSGRTYKVKSSDVGTKLWCWVQGQGEAAFEYNGIWKATNEVSKKTLGSGSLSLSPMSPSVGSPVTATFSMSGVSTSDLEVSWWKGDTWNQAVQVQGWTPYSSGRTYTPKSSDYGTKLWCWVHGSNQNIYDYDGLWKSTYAVTSVEPNTPASGASFYYTANSRLEFKSGSGMKVLEGGVSSPSARLVDSRKFCTVELGGPSSSGTFVITNVTTNPYSSSPYNTYDIAVTVGNMVSQEKPGVTPAESSNKTVYFGFCDPYVYPSGNNFENPNQAGDKVSMWMKSWYWRADVSVKICRQGTTSAIGGFNLASRVSDIDISPGYTSYEGMGLWPPAEWTGSGALYNGFEFVRAGSNTNIAVSGNSYLQQDGRNKTVYSPKMSTPDINTNDDRYAAKLEGTGNTGTVNLKYGGSDCGICFTFETMPAAVQPLASPKPYVVKSADESSIYEGGLVKFTINAKNNNGSLTSAENFVIEDVLPAGLAYVDAVASIVPYGSSRDPETLGSPRVSVSGKTITVKQTQLGGKDQIRLVVTARADGSKLGSVRNNVSAWCDSGSTDRHYADVTILERPRASLSVTKTAEPSEAEPGGEFAWKITVENTSGITANNVTVTDTLPQGFEYASTDKGTVSGGKLTYNHGSLASGASFTVTVKGKAAASTAGTTLQNTAYASCSNGTGDNGTAALSVKKNPALSVEKASDALSYTVGDTVKWTVSVKNTVANTTARDVVVTDEVPAGVEVKNAKASCDDPQANVSASNDGNSVRATCDALPYGKTLVLEIEGVATAAGTLTNAADAESSNGGTAQGESTITVEKPRAALTVAKTAVGGPWAVGDIVSYDVVVTNTSAVDAEDVVVSDTLPAELEPVWCSLGSFKGNVWTYEAGLLPAGKTISARIQAKALVAGEVANTAKAESSNANPSEDKETVTVAPAPEYALSKTAAKDAYKPGETIEWTVTLTRAQDQSARASARAAGLLPASDPGFVTPSAALALEQGAVGVAATPLAESGDIEGPTAPGEGPEPDGGNPDEFGKEGDVSVKDLMQASGVMNPSCNTGGVWKPSDEFIEANLGIAKLKPGESKSWKVTAEVAPDAPDTIANAAVATMPDGSEKRAESVVAVIRPAQLAIAKTSEGETFAVGDVVAWNVELSNVGTSPAFGWKISDTLPAGMEFSSATLSVDGALKATFDAPQESYSVHDAMTQAGALAPGSKAVLHIEAKATAAGEAVNRATGSAEDTAPVEAEDPVTVERPNVEIAKTADAQSYSVGDEVTYSIEVSNTSAHTARGVVVTDALPAELEFVSATAGEFKDGTLTWNVGTMAPGAKDSVQIKAKAKAAGAVANKAVVSVEGCDPNESETIVDVLEPVLSVVKTASAESAEPGDALSWTIEVRNATEGSTAYNVVVTDVLPAGFIAESCDKGRLEGGKFVWEVGDLAFGESAKATISGRIDPNYEGTLVNTAVATSDNSKPAEGSDTVSANGEVTVTFITDVSEMLPQGEKVFEQTVKKGEDFTPGPEADAAGHRDGCTRFDGWFLDPECTKPYTGGPIGDNLTLYGKNYAKIDYAWSALSKFPGETEPQYKAPAATAENLIWINYELPLYDADGRPTSDGTGAPSVEVAYGERYELPAIADPVRYTWGGMAWIEYQAQFWHAREDLSDAALTPAGEKPFATGDATWWCKVAKGRYDGVIG